MLRLQHILALALVAAVGALLVTRYLMAVSESANRQQQNACLALDPEVKQTPAPDFELPDLDGKKRRLSRLRGKVVLLNFWATWCPPCVEELPSMARLQQTLAREDGFRMLTVSVDDNAKVVKRFLEQHKTLFGSLPVLVDPSRKSAAAYGTVKFPETYLIDRTGTVRFRFVNKRNWEDPAALECIRSLLSPN